MSESDLTIVVYSALFGDISDVHTPVEQDRYCKFVMFTDRTRNNGVWEMKRCPSIFPDPRMSAKKYKIFPWRYLPRHDISIWIDANIRIISSKFVSTIVDLLGNNTMMTQNVVSGDRRHVRNCLYQEAKEVLKSRNIGYPVQKQVDRYRDEGMPENFGLWGNGMLVRKDVPRNRQLSVLWWQEIVKRTPRDQISLPYILWKYNLKKPKRFDLRDYEDELFSYAQHKY